MTAGLPLAIWALILIYSLCVLVSHSCCNNLPQIWWLKTRQLILLQFWRSEARNQFRWAAVKVWQGCVLRGYLPPAFPGLRRHLSCPSARGPSSIPRPAAAPLLSASGTRPSLLRQVSLCCPVTRTLVIALTAHWDNSGQSPHPQSSPETHLILHKVTFTGSQDENADVFGGRFQTTIGNLGIPK